MPETDDSLALAVFSEVFALDQMARQRLTQALPKGLELSHVSVLNHLIHVNDERTPAQLAETFHVTRGAMSNTLSKLERAGHVHIRPDWDDARRKFVSVSPAGRAARDQAIAATGPVLGDVIAEIGSDKAKSVLPVLRAIRRAMGNG